LTFVLSGFVDCACPADATNVPLINVHITNVHITDAITILRTDIVLFILIYLREFVGN
jgi:hypothetical protein